MREKREREGRYMKVETRVKIENIRNKGEE